MYNLLKQFGFILLFLILLIWTGINLGDWYVNAINNGTNVKPIDLSKVDTIQIYEEEIILPTPTNTEIIIPTPSQTPTPYRGKSLEELKKESDEQQRLRNLEAENKLLREQRYNQAINSNNIYQQQNIQQNNTLQYNQFNQYNIPRIRHYSPPPIYYSPPIYQPPVRSPRAQELKDRIDAGQARNREKRELREAERRMNR